jgi:hypothetical protein
MLLPAYTRQRSADTNVTTAVAASVAKLKRLTLGRRSFWQAEWTAVNTSLEIVIVDASKPAVEAPGTDRMWTLRRQFFDINLSVVRYLRLLRIGSVLSARAESSTS